MKNLHLHKIDCIIINFFNKNLYLIAIDQARHANAISKVCNKFLIANINLTNKDFFKFFSEFASEFKRIYKVTIPSHSHDIVLQFPHVFQVQTLVKSLDFNNLI